MFKFSKIVVLFIMIISLVACSSSTSTKPEGIRDEIWNAMNVIYDEVALYYYDDKSLNEEVLQENGRIYLKYRSDESLTVKEQLLIDQLITLSTHTVMLSKGDTVESLKDLLSYDYELELQIAKELLNK